MVVDTIPIIKIMPIDLKLIKEYQDTEKCIEKMLGKDKRFHIKILVRQNSQKLMEQKSIYCAIVTEL